MVYHSRIDGVLKLDFLVALNIALQFAISLGTNCSMFANCSIFVSCLVFCDVQHVQSSVLVQNVMFGSVRSLVLFLCDHTSLGTYNLMFAILFGFLWCSTYSKFGFGPKCDVRKVCCSECLKFGILVFVPRLMAMMPFYPHLPKVSLFWPSSKVALKLIRSLKLP